MADIKAKDISVAQSIASSDLILGSSIAGTTANVTVDTLGKYIIDTLPVASLGNVPVSTLINNLQNTIHETYNVLGKEMHLYKCGKIVHIASPDDMRMEINAATPYRLLVLPEAYRPSLVTYAYFGNLYTETDKWLSILPSGTIQFFSLTAMSNAAHNCAFYATYLTV